MPPTDISFESLSLDTISVFNYYNASKKYLSQKHATRYVWGFPSKIASIETYTNFLKQIFQIQIPERLLMNRNTAFTVSKFKTFFETTMSNIS